MADQPANYGRITVQKLQGLNERKQFVNEELGEFDILKGGIPSIANSISKANGINFLHKFDSPVLNICQTNDSRHNVIIQLKDRVIVVTEAELFNQPTYFSNLNYTTTLGDEDTMPQALIVHSAASGTNGGSMPANTPTTTTFNTIIAQTNADGTPANFMTQPGGSTTQFQLAAGVYRIRGWHFVSNNTNTAEAYGFLWNATANQKLFLGLPNENSSKVATKTANMNYKVEVAGNITLAVPTIIEMRLVMNIVQNNTGQGFPVPGLGGINEVYGMLEVTKTA